MRISYFSFVFISTILTISCSQANKITTATGTNMPDRDTSNPVLKKANYSRIDNQTFLLEGVSDDKSYGYSAENAIKVGVGDGGGTGPSNERSYLNALLGPDGQAVTYKRTGSCCPVKSDNGFMGSAMLDRYEITYDGLDKPVYLYLNMYDPGKLNAPVGFKFKTK
jgi:hypothetical protein